MTLRKLVITFVALALMVVCQNRTTYADIVIYMTDNGSGGVSVSGTGSGTITAFRDDQTFTLNDFTPDFLSDTVTSSLITANSTSGMLANNTSGINGNVTAFRVDRDTGSNTDDIEFFVNRTGGIILNPGDSFSFALTSNFNSTTLAFSDLILGSHVDFGGPFDEVFGTVTINVVPEPGTIGLVVVGTGAFWLRRRRG